MVMETTMRSVEYAMQVIKDRGAVCPDQLLVWEPWLKFVVVSVGVMRSMPKLSCQLLQLTSGPQNVSDHFRL